mgnify:CR=1 FL=1
MAPPILPKPIKLEALERAARIVGSCHICSDCCCSSEAINPFAGSGT